MKLLYILISTACFTSLSASESWSFSSDFFPEKEFVSTESCTAGLSSLIHVASRTPSPLLQESTSTASTSSSLESLPAFPKSILKKSTDSVIVRNKKRVTFNDDLKINDFEKYRTQADCHRDPSDQESQNARSLAKQALNTPDTDIKKPNAAVPSLNFAGLKTATGAQASGKTIEVPCVLDYVLGTPSRNTADQQPELQAIQEESDSESDSEDYRTDANRRTGFLLLGSIFPAIR